MSKEAEEYFTERNTPKSAREVKEVLFWSKEAEAYHQDQMKKKLDAFNEQYLVDMSNKHSWQDKRKRRGFYIGMKHIIMELTT